MAVLSPTGGILGSISSQKDFDEDLKKKQEEMERLRKEREFKERRQAAVDARMAQDDENTSWTDKLRNWGLRAAMPTLAEVPLSEENMYKSRYVEDEEGNGKIAGGGDSNTGILLSALSGIIAPEEAKQYAQENVGTPTEIAATEVTPTSPAYNPQQSEISRQREEVRDMQEDPNKQFAQSNIVNAQEAVLSQPTEQVTTDGIKSDFGSQATSMLATLATFGGMLFTGAGIPMALAAAAGAWSGTESMRQREADAQELYKKGYNNAEITNYVHEGILPEVTQAQRAADKQTEIALKQDALQLKKDMAEAKASGAGVPAEFGLSNQQARGIIIQGKQFYDDSNLKRSRMAAAYQAVLHAKELKDQGKDAEAAAAYKQFVESYGKAIQGGRGKINMDEALKIAGPDSLFSRAAMWTKRNLGYAPTDDELDRALQSAERGIEVEHKVITDNLQSVYESLRPIIGDDRARAAAKYYSAGGGIGDWEPEGFKGERTKLEKTYADDPENALYKPDEDGTRYTNVDTASLLNKIKRNTTITR